MKNIVLKNVNKVYTGNVHAVKDFSMEIEEGEFIVFVGPSGCGKSTTLRMIAGLEEITSGELYINDVLVNEYEPKDRNLAMVFQNYALYPYLTVYENIAFGLRLRKFPKAEIDRRVRETAEIFGLTSMLDRKPKALSGGQRQRVALARAVVREAEAYLLDEPLSNLDAKLRGAMRIEITKLYKSLNKTFIYVTHDQVEAMTMGTRIVVMKDGVIQQIDSPVELYDHPENLFVASFIGTPQMNFLNGNLKYGTDKSTITLLQDTKYVIDSNRLKVFEDKELVIGVRSEDIWLSENEEGINAFVSMIEILGSECLVYLKVDTLESELVMKLQGRPTFEVESEIKVILNHHNLHLFEKETENSILKWRE